MRTRLVPVLALVFAVGALIAFAQPADACTQMCVEVSQFCWECQDVGEDTGATCEQSGACFCFFTENNCFSAAADGEEQPEFLAEPAVMTPFVPEADRQKQGEERPLLLEV